jgi:hypothetical protein
MKQSLLARLTSQPDALTHLLSGLSAEQITRRPLPDKWSIRENVAHLGRYQEIFLSRIQQIIGGDTPVFPRYVAEEDPGFPEWLDLSWADLTERFLGERAALNAFLSILHEEQLVQTGSHPLFGYMGIEGWTEFFLLHEAHHFFTILKLGGLLRAAEQPVVSH